MTVSLADIEAVAGLVADVAITTPMEESRWLQALVDGPVLLKCENLQRTGSFKIRGAYVRLSRLSADERARGVVAASAGNHAQGVALAAQILGIKATVFMPEGAPIPKANATRAYGADVRFHGEYLTQALVAAQAFSDETGAVFIHPFDHVDIVAGQGTHAVRGGIDDLYATLVGAEDDAEPAARLEGNPEEPRARLRDPALELAALRVDDEYPTVLRVGDVSGAGQR